MLQMSKNEQDYLKTIYGLEEQVKKESEPSVSVQGIAKRLLVSSPSATEMIKRLAKKNLVLYQPYHGVTLSDLGRAQARFIIKSHRVWEMFLVEKLGYSVEEVHEEAENLEHASSPKLVEHLYASLGYPAQDPHGSEIPTESFWLKNEVELTLLQAERSQRYHLTRVEEEGTAFFKKLNQNLPHLIKVIEKLEDGSLIIKEDNGSFFVVPAFIQPKIHLVQQN